MYLLYYGRRRARAARAAARCMRWQTATDGNNTMQLQLQAAAACAMLFIHLPVPTGYSPDAAMLVCLTGPGFFSSSAASSVDRRASVEAAAPLVCIKDCCLDGTDNLTWTACQPGHEFCGVPTLDQGPLFHLQDWIGCGENDADGIVWGPVHGVFHHFFQKHMAAPPRGGPVYKHFVSKDLIK